MAEGYPWLEAGSQGQAGWGSALPEEALPTESGLVPWSNTGPLWGGDLHQVNWQVLQICPSCSKILLGTQSSALPTVASHPVATALSLPEAANGSLWDIGAAPPHGSASPVFCSTPAPSPPASMLMGPVHFLPSSSTPLTWEIKVRSPSCGALRPA